MLFRSTSGGSNGFVIRIPTNGSKTQTLTLDSTRGFTYAVDTYLSDEIGSLTESTGSLNDLSGSYVDYAGTALDNTVNFTKNKIVY